MFIILLTALLAGCLSCLFSSLHLALRDFSLPKLQELGERSGRSRRIEAIIADPDAHAHAMGAMRALCNVALVVSILLMFPIAHVVGKANDGPTLALNIPMLFGAGAAAALVVYIIAHLIPMSLADHLGERMIYGCARGVRAVYVLCAPLRLLAFVDTAIQRLAGVHHVTDAEEFEEELISVIAEGEREGSFDENEREMIEAIVAFRNHTVEEIMRPRTEIEGFELTNDLGFIRDFINKAGHSRIPVYEGDFDHIVGILYAKDLLRYIGPDAPEFELRTILRSPLFVPETKPINDVLVELKTRKVHLAIVLDEYGGTAGLITIEDILEEIVGDIQDEYEPEDETTPEINVNEQDRTAVVDARANIDDANDELDAIGIELPEGEEYETVGGYVLARLGHIPVPGESFSHNGHAVTVLEAEPTRVTRLRIEAVAPAEAGVAAEREPGDGGEPRSSSST